MQEIISCPSCQRKLQVPESLLGQDVQCPTCGATFVGRGSGPAPVAQAPLSPSYAQPQAPRRRDDYGRGDYDDDYDRYDDDRYRRRHRRDLMPHRGSAVLTMGILSFFICGIILGPIAWAMGQSDLNEMRAGRMDPEGEGITSAGRICGMIATILHGTILVIYLIAIAMTAAAVSRF